MRFPRSVRFGRGMPINYSTTCDCIPFVPFAISLSDSDRPRKVVALGAKHQTLLQRLGQVEADITAAVSVHESREAVSAEEAQKVGCHLWVF